MKYELVRVRGKFLPRGVEPLSLPTYAIIVFGLALSAILVETTGFQIRKPAWLGLLAWPYLAFAGILLRRINYVRFAAALEVIALVYGQGLAFLFALFPLTAMGGPLADRWLASADRALGFDWPSYAWAVAPAMGPLVIAYKSFAWQPLLIIPCLAVARQLERLWIFVTAASIALSITVVMYPFVPALGAYRFLHLGNYPLMGDAPLHFGRVILLLRHGHKVITPDLFTGFVSFPSYHAAAAVLYVWAARPTRLRYPVVLLNLAVCLAIPIVGGHYFVDMLAGFAVAAVGLYGARVLTRAACVARLCKAASAPPYAPASLI